MRSTAMLEGRYLLPASIAVAVGAAKVAERDETHLSESVALGTMDYCTK
ncbi:MAG: hypothetical protein ACYDBA_09830 [Sulfuricaulis sp.]